MFFCPALTSTTGPAPGEPTGGYTTEYPVFNPEEERGFSFRGGGDGGVNPLESDYNSGSAMMGTNAALSALQPEAPNGMFSEFETNLGGCFLP